jgi:hypothetical protein
MEEDEAIRLMQLELENSRVKRIVAEQVNRPGQWRLGSAHRGSRGRRSDGGLLLVLGGRTAPAATFGAERSGVTGLCA